MLDLEKLIENLKSDRTPWPLQCALINFIHKGMQAKNGRAWRIEETANLLGKQKSFVKQAISLNEKIYKFQDLDKIHSRVMAIKLLNAYKDNKDMLLLQIQRKIKEQNEQLIAQAERRVARSKSDKANKLFGSGTGI